MYIYIIIYKLDVLYCYIYLIQKQYIWKVIIQPCSNQMKSPASASSSTRQKLTTPLRSMALDDDSGTTFFLGRKRGAKRWENQDFTGRNHEIRWRLAGFPPAKTVMCGFDFRQKIGESLGNLRMFRDCLAAKIHFKKKYGDFNIKTKTKTGFGGHTLGYPVS